MPITNSRRYVHSPTSVEIDGVKVEIKETGKVLLNGIEVSASVITTLAKLFDSLGKQKLGIEITENDGIIIYSSADTEVVISKDAVGRLFTMLMATRRIEHGDSN